MKKSILNIILVAGIGLSVMSCEDHLDIEKHGNMGGQETYYQNDEEADNALASLYVTLRSNYFNWYYLKNLLADDVWTGGGGRNDNADMEFLNEYTYTSNNSLIEGTYSGLYTLIYKASLITDKVKDDTAEKRRCIAEAQFYRALAHFELVTLWGTAPVVNHVLQPSEYRPSNSTPAELWSQVETDLNAAINSNALPSKTDVNDKETGIRITKEVAQAMLGKAYLFQGKYTEAATMFEKVIGSGKYALYTGDYDQLLHAVANNCSEAMIEIQMRNDADQGWNQMTMTYLMSGWRTGLLRVNGKAATEIATGTYGFLNPKKDLYDAFVKEEGVNGYRLNSTMRTSKQMEEYGVSVISKLYGSEGYFMWKNRSLLADCIYDASYFQALQYINLRVMRYAEVLLMAAEANLQAGNKDKALTYVNMIRTRAKVAPLTSVTLDDIKNEKRLELCIEGCRYQDLVRWGDAKTVLAKQGEEVPSYTSEDKVEWGFKNSTFGFKDKHNLLPIPLTETELNPNMKQNEGWK